MAQFLVHYSRGEPFRSLGAVSPEELNQVVAKGEIWGASRFSDPHYLARRREVELKLRSALLAAGGRPELEFPYYCFLGRNPGFERHPANIGYRLELADISAGALTFTYGDSLLCHEAYRPHAGEGYQNALCERIFGAHDLPHLLAAVPAGAPLAIEAQLWIQPPSAVIRKL